MRNLLAVGDSLIAGRYGASLLENTDAVKRTNLTNRGQDGEPMKGIFRNLQVHLKNRTTDILLLDGGANDLLIPHMNEHHPEEWALFFRKLARHGSTPVRDEEEFQEILEQALQSALEAEVGYIVLLNIPCLGENLGTPLNQKRLALNSRIRSAAEQFQDKSVYLADLARPFEKALEPVQPGSDWLFRSPRDLGAPWSEEESQNRGLHYTIDGVHLNHEGALLAGKELDRILQAILEKAEKGGLS